MTDDLKVLRPWLMLAGGVLVVGILHWAQAILVPVCLAILLTFVLTPPVLWLQRRVGRIAAVLTVVIAVFTFLGLAGYGVYRQMASMSNELPIYGSNIRTKIRDVRGLRAGGSVEKLERTLDQIKGEIGTEQPMRGTTTQPVVVTQEPIPGFSAIGWLGPIIEPLTTGGFVVTLVLFMLLDRVPSTAAKARYLIKKLRAAVPDVRIAVGRWASSEISDDGAQTLAEAGASHVASTLLDTRNYLVEGAQFATPSASSTAA